MVIKGIKGVRLGQVTYDIVRDVDAHAGHAHVSNEYIRDNIDHRKSWGTHSISTLSTVLERNFPGPLEWKLNQEDLSEKSLEKFRFLEELALKVLPENTERVTEEFIEDLADFFIKIIRSSEVRKIGEQLDKGEWKYDLANRTFYRVIKDIDESFDTIISVLDNLKNVYK